MPRHSDANAQHVDSKTRRKLEDQRRMQFRRAIEDHCEELRLRQELADYPRLVAAAYLRLEPPGPAKRPASWLISARSSRTKATNAWATGLRRLPLACTRHQLR